MTPRRDPRKPKLSLVQIMVAVAILGTAASLAIPRYMKDVFAERQTECPQELRKIAAAENEYYQRYQRYTEDLRQLNWKAPITSYYLYGFRDGSSEYSDLPETSFSENKFLIGCAGNIDADEKLDRFTIDEKGVLVHHDNDLE